MAQKSRLTRKTTTVTVEATMLLPPLETSRVTRSAQQSRLSRLDLTVPARSRLSKASRSRTKIHRTDDDYVFDNSDDEGRPKTTDGSFNRGQRVYKKLCNRYGRLPLSSIIRQFGKRDVSLNNHNLHRKDLKALFVALIEHYVNDDDDDETDDEDDISTTTKTLKRLSLDGNRITARQINYVIDLARSHTALTNVSLTGCSLCPKCVSALGQYLADHRTITRLDISDNYLTDSAGDSIGNLILQSKSITELSLRGNKLSEAAKEIGKALVENWTLKILDLSWNHIRGRNATALCRGLKGLDMAISSANTSKKENTNLETLLLAWNGFGYEGCVAMAEALAANTTLRTLDMTNNRIHSPALLQLLPGIQGNKALIALKLGLNPITSNVTSPLLTKILEAKESSLQELDLQGIVVDKDFNEVLSKIREERLFIVKYGNSLPLNTSPITAVDPNNVFNIDPVQVLRYVKDHLWTLDLFLKVSSAGELNFTKEEMKFSFERDGLPISDSALQIVIEYLKANKDRHLDLLETVNGQKRLKPLVFKEEEVAMLTASAEEGDSNEHKSTHQGNMNVAPLPPRILPSLN